MWEIVNHYLKDEGIVLMAQDPTEYLSKDYNEYFESRGFKVEEILPSWGIFKLERNEIEAINEGTTVKIQSDDRILCLSRL